MMAVQVPVWFKNIYAAQKGWDTVMADSMRVMLAKKEFKGYKGVIIAGNNHVAYKLGIPFRYKKSQKRVRLTTISPILLAKPKDDDDEDEDGHPMMAAMAKYMDPASLFSRGIADYVFSATQPKFHHYPVLGITIKERDKKIIVNRISKKSMAYKQGIRKWDQITSLDGVEITSPGQLRSLLALKKWDDSFHLGMVKMIQIKKEDKEKEKSAKKPGEKAKKKEMKKETKVKK
jgi:hypothetical protein